MAKSNKTQKETNEEKKRRTTCRACSNGWGDGICSRHAHQLRIATKKAVKGREP